MASAGSRERACQLGRSAGRGCSELELHLAQLNRRLNRCVVRDITHDRVCMRSEAGLEAFHGVEVQMPHDCIYGRRSGGAASHALFDRRILARRTKPGPHHRNVLVQIVAQVERAACGLGINTETFSTAPPSTVDWRSCSTASCSSRVFCGGSRGLILHRRCGVRQLFRRTGRLSVSLCPLDACPPRRRSTS
jgi:hypothetical protein